MITIKVCMGSSCFLKGAAKVVEFLRNKINENKLNDKIELKANLCDGSCNRIGVTIHVNEKAFVGVNVEDMENFWNKNIISILF